MQKCSTRADSAVEGRHRGPGHVADGAMFKHGNLGQGIYVDPGRDVVGIHFSTNGYIPPYGEDKLPGFFRRAAKMLAER
jgi:hypothetical protein